MIRRAAMKCTAAVEPLVPPFPNCRLHLYCPRLAANQGPPIVFLGSRWAFSPRTALLSSFLPDPDPGSEAGMLSRVAPLLNWYKIIDRVIDQETTKGFSEDSGTDYFMFDQRSILAPTYKQWKWKGRDYMKYVYWQERNQIEISEAWFLKVQERPQFDE